LYQDGGSRRCLPDDRGVKILQPFKRSKDKGKPKKNKEKLVFQWRSIALHFRNCDDDINNACNFTENRHNATTFLIEGWLLQKGPISAGFKYFFALHRSKYLRFVT